MGFLQETVWILCTYGVRYSAGGLAIALVMVIWGSRRVRLGWRIAVLVAATLVLWIALFVGVESGYHAWQSTPNPPAEAFSDTGGPFFFLFLGWLPSFVILGIAHLLLRLCWRALAPTAPSQPPQPGMNADKYESIW